jgi:KDO2-lipid IV(A) lauroyltransferase
MHEIRSRWDTTQIEMSQTVRTLLQWHAKGEPFLCGFIQDQRPDRKAKDSIMFLNQQTWYIPGAEEIARKANAELIYLDVEKPSRGHYRLTFREMIPNEEEANSRYPLSQNFWHKMEQTIRRQPELWLWSHNRWRSKIRQR